MKRYILLIVIICIIAVSVTRCGRKQDLERPKVEGPILAKIGDEIITLDEFNDRITMLPDNIKGIAQSNKAGYLDNLIFETLLYKEALKRKLDEDKEIQRIYEEAEKRILIARLVKEEVEEKIEIDEKEVLDYYEEHKDELKNPELLKASHILVPTLEEAVEIVDKLNTGAPFGKLAEEYSIDVTNKRGGDIGYFSAGQMVPEFEDAAFRLKVGEISGPIKTQFGYHIIKLTDRKKSEPIEFDKIKDRIRDMLTAQKRRVLLDGLLTKLRSETDITINSELIEPKEEIREPTAEGLPQEG